jgi:HEAT repeat protein
MADRRAVEPLIATLQDKDSYVRLMAASALGDIGDSRAVEPLLKTFKDDLAEDTRSYAAKALGKINSAPANEAVLTALQTALKDKNLNIRCAAACALGDMKVTKAIPSLVELLGHNAYCVREAASAALAEIGKPAVESLLKSLDNEDPRTRQHAAVALGMIGDRRAVGPLINRLDDKDGIVQGKVIEVLEKITGQKYGQHRDKWRTWWRSAADAPPR